ncbi:MAG: ABC transporter substrate-binding protein [Candidatus Competibacterales bacterium]
MTRRAAVAGQSWLWAACVALTASVGTVDAADEPFKIGIVTFLSGGAAGPFGVPAKNAADLMVEALNQGQVPAPYDQAGLGGRPIETVVIDEAGGATKQVAEFRNLVERQEVDAVVGYISSGDCLAIPSVAEELKTLTVLFDCGTPRVFEEGDYQYVFRTGPTATMDNVAAARYVLAMMPELENIAGINQNYAWGQDSWRDFSESVKQLKPDVNVTTEQFPKLFAGQYGAEISALMVRAAQVVHSSFWGGDMEGFVLQGSARGLFETQTPLLTTGETAMFRFASQIPEGAIIGARGPFGVYAPDTELNAWFRQHYSERFDTPPIYPSYKMAQALLGLKTAYEKAQAAAGQTPSTEEIVAAFENLTFEGPGGTVAMTLGNGHQAVMEMVYGRFAMEDGQPTMTDVVRFPAGCVNPPPDMTSSEWIAAGFPGNDCPTP